MKTLGLIALIPTLVMGGSAVAQNAGEMEEECVSVDGSGDPMPGWVRIYGPEGVYLGMTSLGNAVGRDIENGAYYAQTGSRGFFEEVWNEIPGCVTSRTSSTKAGGAVTGTVTAAGSGIPIPDGWVAVYDVAGSYLGLASLDNAGTYSYGGLEPGTYFARTDSTGFFDELWDDIPCAQDNCVVTLGTPISVAAAPVIADFELDAGGAITGTVTAAGSGTPIPDGWVAVYDVAGSYLGLASLDNAGTYSYGGLEPGTYFARTDSTGFFDELWDDIPCAQDNCVVTSGTPILINAAPVTANFELGEGQGIFSDGFESGDTTAWSATTP